MKKSLTDLGAERGVLAGLCKHGKPAYLDVCDLIDCNTFTESINQLIYKCLEYIFQSSDNTDIPSVLSTANTLGFAQNFSNKETEYLKAIFNFPVHLENVRNHAKKILKLHIARNAQNAHKEAFDNLDEIRGDESIDDILGISEKPILDFSYKLHQGEDITENIGAGGMEELKQLIENPIQNVGIPSPYPIYNELIGGGIRVGITLIAARLKTGKMQPEYSMIYTKNGPIELKNIKVGDEVATPFGTFSKITDIFEHGIQQVYRVWFNDYTYTDCGLEHLWEVKNLKKDHFEVLTLEEMLKYPIYSGTQARWQINITSPINYDKKEVLIDPYIMGLLLGDGSFRGTVALTNKDEQLINSLKNYIEQDDNQYIKKTGKMTYRISSYNHINKYKNYIRYYNLWNTTSHTKFIPECYKYGSIEQRLSIIQGLMDTDGTPAKYGIEYATTSLQLANDVKEIIESLGGLCRIRLRTTKCNNRRFPSYRLYIATDNNKKLFRLQSKIDKAFTRTKGSLKRSIKEIYKIGEYNCKCIKIEDNRGLYLTDNHIITHNSTNGVNIAYHTASIGVPTLYIDTEMSKTDLRHKIRAKLSGVKIRTIETGKFGSNPAEYNKVIQAQKQLESVPLYYRKVSGKSFDEIISIMRRWIFQHVRFGSDGKPNPHVVVYDYFKLMDTDDMSDMAEHQALGFQVNKLSDFCGLNNTSCMAFVQSNRDGISKETSDIISQSDRIGWAVTSITIMKRKAPEEIAEDGPQNGNIKMIPIDCRYGPGCAQGDYINMAMNGEMGNILEVSTRSNPKK